MYIYLDTWVASVPDMTLELHPAASDVEVPLT